jgi:hypothetical protein
MQELAVSESLSGAAVSLKLALGVPLCLIGPFVITALLVGIDGRLDLDILPGFGLAFLIVSAILVPLLLRLERHTRGEFLADSVRGEESPFRASSYGEYELQSTKLGWIAWTEIALTGPRLIWEAYDALRGRPTRTASRGEPLRVLAAEVVVELLDRGEGMPVRELVKSGRSELDVSAAIDYLVQRDFAGVSSRRDRVWLSTPVRERLTRL